MVKPQHSTSTDEPTVFLQHYADSFSTISGASHGYDGSVMLIVNGDMEKWSQICSETKVAGSFGAPLTMPYENGVVILCKGLRHPLPEIWDSFKRLH